MRREQRRWKPLQTSPPFTKARRIAVVEVSVNSSAGSSVMAEQERYPGPGDFVASMSVRKAVWNSEGRFPTYNVPREIGNFSVIGEERECVDGAVQLKYLQMPSRRRELTWDLNRGYEVAVRRDLSRHDKLNKLLRWMLRNREKLALNRIAAQPSSGEPQSRHVDFVCNGGQLQRLVCTAYSASEEWLMAACRFRGIIYLCCFETETERRRRIENMEDPRCNRMSFWGHKFEQYMVSGEPDGVPDVDAVVNEREGYIVVLRSRLESHSIVFAAEMDAVDHKFHHGHHQEGSLAEYVELKTCREFSSERQRYNFRRFKLLKWWAQSYLAGVPRVICGFRDDDGFVHRLQEFNVAEMEDAAEAEGLWSKAVSLSVCDQVLSFVKDHVTDDAPGVVYLFRYLPPSLEVVCTRLTYPGRFALLPDWYLQAFDSP